MRISQKAREEELRLLYVVMTRAEEKLVFFIPYSKTPSSPLNVAAQNLLCFADANKGISSMAFMQSKNIATWISMYALLLSDFSELREEFGISPNIIPMFIRENHDTAKLVLTDGEPEVFLANKESEENIKAEDFNVLNIAEIFDFEYPFKELNEIEAKTSVSKLAKKSSGENYFALSRPAFLSNQGLTPTERGNALHKFMQYADFTKLKSSAEDEINRLYEQEFLSKAETESIKIESINSFANTEIFGRILSADRVLKEQRFLLELPAAEIKEDLRDNIKDQKIIVQGAIDCMFFENGEIVLIDFKTDRTNDENVLLSNYKEQLKIYSIAAERVFPYVSPSPVFEDISASSIAQSSMLGSSQFCPSLSRESQTAFA
jgi:ATP-dependent helicase/nuclease subunit A